MSTDVSEIHTLLERWVERVGLVPLIDGLTNGFPLIDGLINGFPLIDRLTNWFPLIDRLTYFW